MIPAQVNYDLPPVVNNPPKVQQPTKPNNKFFKPPVKKPPDMRHLVKKNAPSSNNMFPEYELPELEVYVNEPDGQPNQPEAVPQASNAEPRTYVTAKKPKKPLSEKQLAHLATGLNFVLQTAPSANKCVANFDGPIHGATSSG